MQPQYKLRAGWLVALPLLLGFAQPPAITAQEKKTVSADSKAGSALQNRADYGSSQSETCKACHEEIVTKFASTRHGKADKFQAWGFTQSCGSCHGDVTEHAETGDPAKILSPAEMGPAKASQACVSCHLNESHQAFWQGSAHETSSLSCLSCHSVHHAKAPEKLLTKRTGNETCLSCHIDLRKAQFQRSTHLFKDENRNALIGCIDCHNPHGSPTAKLIKGDSVNDTCYSCHTEKRGPFLWQHSPSQENCLTCHTPHGSNNINLLTMRAPQLCQSCHMQGRHQTVAAKPNAAWVFNRACLNCHSQVHGSNHPSGAILQR